MRASKTFSNRQSIGAPRFVLQVLVVGAGGIGCELVKNLVLSGFESIMMIDLDTIDYSNLNRQFLFRGWHVGKSKAEVAREAVLAFPHDALDITAEHNNIKSKRYDLEFFKQFDIVLNALDNVDARRHVNNLSRAARGARRSGRHGGAANACNAA